MIEYAQALNKAALRKFTIAPKKPNPKAGTRPLVFLLGKDGTDLNTLHKQSVVWSLTSFNQLLKEHDEADIIVYKKGHKRGIIGAEVDGGPKIRRAYERPIGLGLSEYLAAYQWVNDYLASFGVSFTSSSWASEQVFRLGFEREITLSNPLGRQILGASRGVCFPGYTYMGPLEKWDIRSAYPYAMVANAHKFPTKAIPIEPNQWDKRPVTLTFARVLTRNLPEQDLPVIQVHSLDTENPGIFYGWFWRFELETIADQFHDITPIISFKFKTADLSDEIGRWQEILSPRYEGIGFAGKILKSIANALWGAYAAGDVYSYTWKLDEWGNAITDEPIRRMYSGKVGGEHVAAWNNALVSNRVFNEFIEPENVVYFDTDGGFCRPVANTLGNGDFGQWRYEGVYNKLEVIGWQAYAAWNDDGIDVILSGVPDATYKDLKRYGADDRRQNFLDELMESSEHKFNRITVVDTNRNTCNNLPYDDMVGMELGDGVKLIAPEVAPHVSHFSGDRHTDGWLPIATTQAQALAKLSEVRLDKTVDAATLGDATQSDTKGRVQNGRHESQGNHEGEQGRFVVQGELRG